VKEWSSTPDGVKTGGGGECSTRRGPKGKSKSETNTSKKPWETMGIIAYPRRLRNCKKTERRTGEKPGQGIG